MINPGPTLAGNAPALAAFERAAQLWESFIADPITVVVDADVAPLGPGILGSTGSELLTASFSTIRNAMVADAADEGADDAIVASLPGGGELLGRPSGRVRFGRQRVCVEGEFESPRL